MLYNSITLISDLSSTQNTVNKNYYLTHKFGWTPHSKLWDIKPVMESTAPLQTTGHQACNAAEHGTKSIKLTWLIARGNQIYKTQTIIIHRISFRFYYNFQRHSCPASMFLVSQFVETHQVNATLSSDEFKNHKYIAKSHFFAYNILNQPRMNHPTKKGDASYGYFKYFCQYKNN